MKKGGQANIFFAVLIVVVAVVAVVFVYNIVNPLISEKFSGVKSGFENYLKSLSNNINDSEMPTSSAPSSQIGTSISSCGEITSSGSYYLEDDLTATGNCIVVKANNITIDLNGYTIGSDKWADGKHCSGAEYEDSKYSYYIDLYDGYNGIDIRGYNNTIVKNGKLYNFGRGIYAFNSYNNEFSNLDISTNISKYYCFLYGIFVSKGGNNLIKNNNINIFAPGEGVSLNAIYLEESSGNVIEDNVLDANYEGGMGYNTIVYINNGTDNALRWNNVCRYSETSLNIKAIGDSVSEFIDNRCVKGNVGKCLICQDSKMVSNVKVQLFLLKNITVCNIPGMGCLNLKLNPSEIDSAKLEIGNMMSNFTKWTDGSLNFTLEVIEIPSGNVNMTQWGGYWISPADANPLISNYITKDTDFIFVTNKMYVDNERFVPTSNCGMAIDPKYGIGGAGYAWVAGAFYSPGLNQSINCATQSTYGHEFLNVMAATMIEVDNVPNIYRSGYPSCGSGDSNTHKWFPVASNDHIIDPDFVACGWPSYGLYCDSINLHCEFLWQRHLLTAHYNQSMNFIGNYYRTTSKLLSYWKLDDSTGSLFAVDSILGYDGGVNGAEFVDDALRGRVAKFNGSSYISVYNGVYYLDKEVTISAWVKPATLSKPMDLVLKILNFRLLWENNNGFEFVIWGNVSYVGVAYTGNSGFNANQWYHVVGVYNAGSGLGKIYINGVDTTNSGTPLSESMNPLGFGQPISIGFYPGIDYYNFNGSIDNVMIYNKALNDNEVWNLYCNQGGSC